MSNPADPPPAKSIHHRRLMRDALAAQQRAYDLLVDSAEADLATAYARMAQQAAEQARAHEDLVAEGGSLRARLAAILGVIDRAGAAPNLENLGRVLDEVADLAKGDRKARSRE